MRRNWRSLAQWQFLISCHRASEHDSLTVKLRGHVFGSRVLPRTAPPCLINKSRLPTAWIWFCRLPLTRLATITLGELAAGSGHRPPHHERTHAPQQTTHRSEHHCYSNSPRRRAPSFGGTLAVSRLRRASPPKSSEGQAAIIRRGRSRSAGSRALSLRTRIPFLIAPAGPRNRAASEKRPPPSS